MAHNNCSQMPTTAGVIGFLFVAVIIGSQIPSGPTYYTGCELPGAIPNCEALMADPSAGVFTLPAWTATPTDKMKIDALHLQEMRQAEARRWADYDKLRAAAKAEQESEDHELLRRRGSK